MHFIGYMIICEWYVSLQKKCVWTESDIFGWLFNIAFIMVYLFHNNLYQKIDTSFRGSRRKSTYILILTLYWMCNVFGLMSTSPLIEVYAFLVMVCYNKNDYYLGNCLLFLNQSFCQFDFYPSSGIKIPVQVGFSERACLSHWKFSK